jgi:uncharacterized protein YqjF (DUF2071 family)
MTYGPEPQERVRRPVMEQTWDRLTFIHWRYRPESVQALLPPDVEIDTFAGSAWVGLTPFLLRNLRLPSAPPFPYLSPAPETNVRTYVRGPDQKRGIWFFSLDIARLPAVLFARSVYSLPYMWATMEFEDRGGVIRYSGRRRWPAGGHSYDITVEVGEPYAEAELAELDHFLTARWVLYTRYARRPVSVSARHQRWPLVRARTVELRQDLVEAAGLPAPSGDPLVHFSPGVDVRIGAPKILHQKRVRARSGLAGRLSPEPVAG